MPVGITGVLVRFLKDFFKSSDGVLNCSGCNCLCYVIWQGLQRTQRTSRVVTRHQSDILPQECSSVNSEVAFGVNSPGILSYSATTIDIYYRYTSMTRTVKTCE